MAEDPEPEAAERALVLSYAPRDARDALAALLALDDALARLLRTTSEPALGQIRLQWWRDALLRLDEAPAPAEPVLEGLARSVLPRGVRGVALSEIIAGWDVLIEEEHLGEAALRSYADGRGARLFEAAGQALGAGPGDPVADAGAGWALADLARNLRDPEDASRARSAAQARLARAMQARWSPRSRALGALALLARRDLALPPGAPPPVGAPDRVARLLWHRLSGR